MDWLTLPLSLRGCTASASGRSRTEFELSNVFEEHMCTRTSHWRRRSTLRRGAGWSKRSSRLARRHCSWMTGAFEAAERLRRRTSVQALHSPKLWASLTIELPSGNGGLSSFKMIARCGAVPPSIDAVPCGDDLGGPGPDSGAPQGDHQTSEVVKPLVEAGPLGGGQLWGRSLGPATDDLHAQIADIHELLRGRFEYTDTMLADHQREFRRDHLDTNERIDDLYSTCCRRAPV